VVRPLRLHERVDHLRGRRFSFLAKKAAAFLGFIVPHAVPSSRWRRRSYCCSSVVNPSCSPASISAYLRDRVLFIGSPYQPNGFFFELGRVVCSSCPSLLLLSRNLIAPRKRVTLNRACKIFGLHYLNMLNCFGGFRLSERQESSDGSRGTSAICQGSCSLQASTRYGLSRVRRSARPHRPAL
jgi:hypothetical protein